MRKHLQMVHIFCEDKLLQNANIQLYILAPEVCILVLVILSISKPWLYIKYLALVLFGYLNILFSQSPDKMASISLQYPPITSCTQYIIITCLRTQPLCPFPMHFHEVQIFMKPCSMVLMLSFLMIKFSRQHEKEAIWVSSKEEIPTYRDFSRVELLHESLYGTVAIVVVAVVNDRD